MRLETTIEVIINGVCLFDCDVTVCIDYTVDRWNELEWRVDQYLIEGERRLWNADGTSAGTKQISFAVPEYLAEVFDKFLDRETIEDKLRDALVEAAE